MPPKKPKWIQDPNQPNQEIAEGTPTWSRNKPEETLRQIGISRAAGNVPLPPETQEERNIKEKELTPAKPPITPLIPPMDVFGRPQITQPQPPQPLQPSNAPPIEQPTGVYPEGSIPNKIASFFGRNVPQKTIAQGTGELIIKPIAEVYDFVYSLTKGGKSIKQVEAEKTLNSIQADMVQDLALIKAGLKDPNEVDLKIQIAEDALSRLREVTKGTGKLNLRYWLVDGKDIEKQIIISQDNLRSYRLQLAGAAAEFSLNQARATYGSQPLR